MPMSYYRPFTLDGVQVTVQPSARWRQIPLVRRAPYETGMEIYLLLDVIADGPVEHSKRPFALELWHGDPPTRRESSHFYNTSWLPNRIGFSVITEPGSYRVQAVASLGATSELLGTVAAFDVVRNTWLIPVALLSAGAILGAIIDRLVF